MPFLALPADELDNPIKLADWLEISALQEGDQSSSGADLAAALRPTGRFRTKEEIDTVCGEVFSELDRRRTAGVRGYPFDVDGGLVIQRGARADFIAYVFCLCLSYFGWRQRKGDKLFPARMFEDLAALAAKNFLQGDSYRFAAPRRDIPDFRRALEGVTVRLGEGRGCKQQDTRSAQDDNLDIVAWRHFPDRLPGKLILFGQCSAGADWDDDKLMSLNPSAFCKYWLQEQPLVDPIKAYFIPHRVPKQDWDRVNTFGGIMFDRCRIAYWAHSGKPLKVIEPYVTWIGEKLSATSQ